MFKVNPETYEIQIIQEDTGLLPIRLVNANGTEHILTNTETLIMTIYNGNEIIAKTFTAHNTTADWTYDEDNNCYLFTIKAGDADLIGDYYYTIVLNTYSENVISDDDQYHNPGDATPLKINHVVPPSLFRILPKSR